MRTCSALLMVAATFFFCGDSSARDLGEYVCDPDPGFSFHFESPESAESGSTITISGLLDNPGGVLAGWSFVTCFNENIEAISVRNSDALLTVNAGMPADFAYISVFPGGTVVHAVVVSFYSIAVLPAGMNHPVFEIDCVLSGPSGATALIEVCNPFNDVTQSSQESLVALPGGIAVCPLAISGQVSIKATEFIRGDCNGDGFIQISDPIFLLEYLMNGGRTSGCQDSADVNDDGELDLSDPTFLLAYLSGAGLATGSSIGTCGVDASADSLDCTSYNGCP